VHFFGLNFAGPGAGDANASIPIDFGPYFVICTPGCGGGGGTLFDLPITLGTDYTFFEAQNASADSGDFHGGITVGGTLTAEFFEADGVTPVHVFEATPEPHVGALVTVGLLCLLGNRRSVKRK
jgi:hypothetical protein